LESKVNKFFNTQILMITAMLTGCGGGGDASTAPSTQLPPPLALSETQRSFEETVLAVNGGVYSLSVNTTSSGTTITTTSAQFVKTDLPKSPLGLAGGVTSTVSVGNDLIRTLPTPVSVNDSNPNVGSAFIDNGQLYFFAAAAPAKITYLGDNIISDTLAPTGQSGSKVLITGYKKIPLTGTLASAPIEFLDLTKSFASYTDRTKSFLSGAEYYQRVSKRVGDHLFISDGDNNAATNPQSATPLYTGTIEQYAFATPSSLVLTKGTIKTIKGARCWVNNVSGASNGAVDSQTFSSVLPQFGAFCEVAGKTYGASLQPDGAESGSNYLTGLTTPAFSRYAFQMRLNKAAFDSVKAALP
jgi:hypothetical protein